MVFKPEGRHKLRFEFEVTGKPDIENGKGAPGLGRLYIDGKLVGEVDIPLTIPLSLGLGGGIMCGADVAVIAFMGLMVPPNMLFTVYHTVMEKRREKKRGLA